MDQLHGNNSNNNFTNAGGRRAAANRANAGHSTGPRTEGGKNISKLNAVKTGLTGRTVLLPGDDMARYGEHVAQWQAEWKPEGPREAALVQAIADSYWRAERVVRLEFALYAAGRIQFADFDDENAGETDAATKAHLLDAKTYLAYEKQFRNLAIQEGRLRRAREKDQAELLHLQDERRELALAAEAKAEAERPSAEAGASNTEGKGNTQGDRTRTVSWTNAKQRTGRGGFVFETDKIARNKTDQRLNEDRKPDTAA